MDAHVHVGSPASQAGDTQYTAERARLAGRAAGLSRAWLVANGYQKDSARADVQRENDYVLEAQRGDFPSFVAAVAVPVGAPWAGKELARVHSRGAQVLKLHPVASQVDPATEAGAAHLEGILREAQALGMVVVIHANFEGEGRASALLEIVRRHSVKPVVLAHGLTRFHRLLRGVREPHIFIDTSGALAWPYFMNQGRWAYSGEAGQFAEEMVASWRAFGLERVLFGSDMPFLTPAEALHLLRSLPLSAEEVDVIVRGAKGPLSALGASCAG